MVVVVMVMMLMVMPNGDGDSGHIGGTIVLNVTGVMSVNTLDGEK